MKTAKRIQIPVSAPSRKYIVLVKWPRFVSGVSISTQRFHAHWNLGSVYLDSYPYVSQGRHSEPTEEENEGRGGVSSIACIGITEAREFVRRKTWGPETPE